MISLDRQRGPRQAIALAPERMVRLDSTLNEVENGGHPRNILDIFVDCDPELALGADLTWQNPLQRRLTIDHVGREHADPDAGGNRVELGQRARAAVNDVLLADRIAEPFGCWDFD